MSLSRTIAKALSGPHGARIGFVLLLCCGLAVAQVETTTSITGTVTDQLGAVMTGAVVKLTNHLF